MKIETHIITFGAILALAVAGCGKSKYKESVQADASAQAVTSVSNKLAAIVAAGEPVTPQELNASYAEPAASDNAAGLYAQAFEALADIQSGKPVAPAVLARNQKAVALLLQGAERNACRYPVNLEDGYSAKLPHLAKIKNSAWLLKAEALNQVERGRTDAAAKTLGGIIALGRSLQNEPILISKLVEAACVAYVSDAMQQAFTRRAFTAAQLQSLQSALGQIEGGAFFRPAVLGERVSVIAAFQGPAENLAREINMTNANNIRDMETYQKSPVFQKDFEFALDYFSNLLAVLDLPFPQSLAPEAQAAIPKIESAKQSGYMFSNTLLPALGQLNQKGADITARIRVTQAGLAIERYRLKHANALPSDLADLTPEFIAAVPADPFDGQVLRYKKLPGKGYVVYSISKNLVDDGGVEKSADGKTQLDLVFAVKR